jgi:hypothetical protein
LVDEFEVNVQLTSVGLQEIQLAIPPPVRAELPLNVQFISVGLLR